MPVEENLMQAILLTFGTAMVPVLELRGAIPVGVAADSPRPRLPGVHPGQYGAGALYPAADPPDLRLAPGHPPFRPQDRLAGAPGSPEGPDGAEVPPAGTHHSGSHPLPGTGPGRGSGGALLDIRMRHALPAIFLGVVIAGAIVTTLTYGVVQLF